MELPKAQTRGEPIPWHTRIRALRYVSGMLRMLWETSPALVLGSTVLRICRSMLPVCTLWVSKLILDAVVSRILHRSGSLTFIWKLVAAQFLLAILADLLGRGQTLFESLLADHFGQRISLRIMKHATQLDLASFEDPAFCDKLARARGQTSGRLDLLAAILDIGQDTLSLISMSAGLFIFSPWLMALLIAAVIPAFLGEAHFSKLGYSILYRRTPERRLLDYLVLLGTSPQSTKEVKLFGLGSFLGLRYKEISDRAMAENRAVSIKKALVGSLLSLISTAGYYGAYAFVLTRTLAGVITVGMFTFLSGAFMRSHGYIERILSGFNKVSEQALFLKDLFEFFETEPVIRARPAAIPAPKPVREGFRFENVGFAYPGSDRWVVRNVNFELRRDEKIALIGKNGAGKTTLVKLMARLYDPTEGRILLDGVDLREYDPEDLLSAIGVIFQDYMRYDMPVRENIGVGKIES